MRIYPQVLTFFIKPQIWLFHVVILLTMAKKWTKQSVQSYCFCPLKAMLHEAIFLATRNATMTNKKPFKLQRVCFTLATSFATFNAYNNKQDGDALSRQKMSSDWPILTKLRCELQRGCHTQATCLATLRKVEGRSTFLATRNATIAVAKWGVIT